MMDIHGQLFKLHGDMIKFEKQVPNCVITILMITSFSMYNV